MRDGLVVLVGASLMPYDPPPALPHTQPYVAACPGCGRDALWLCRRVPHSGNDGAALEVRCTC